MPVGVNVDQAWYSACASVDETTAVTIDGADHFTNGTYAPDSSILPTRNGRPPHYCRKDAQSRKNMWLYMDGECRWRVAYKSQAMELEAGDAGFIRSERVTPGTLPGSAQCWEEFTSNGWRQLPDAKVTGAMHEMPDVALFLHLLRPRSDGTAAVRCMSIAGVELATVSCVETQLLSEFRIVLAATLRFPSRKLRLLLPDGRLLSDAEDTNTVVSVLGDCEADCGDFNCGQYEASWVDCRARDVCQLRPDQVVVRQQVDLDEAECLLAMETDDAADIVDANPAIKAFMVGKGRAAREEFLDRLESEIVV